jgi:phosphoglycerate dehydrogenase-like enzyme
LAHRAAADAERAGEVDFGRQALARGVHVMAHLRGNPHMDRFRRRPIAVHTRGRPRYRLQRIASIKRHGGAAVGHTSVQRAPAVGGYALRVKVALPELFRAVLDGRLPAFVEPAWYTGTADVALAAHGADVLVIGFIDAAEIRYAIESASNAAWVSTHAAGVDHYPIDLLAQRNIVLTNGAGINAPPIAEFAVLCVLSAAKTFPLFVRSSDRKEWPTQRPPAQELDGSRALILGYGEIGRGIAERLRPFGVEVTAVRRLLKPSEEPDVIGPHQWRERLATYDWVLVAAALTPQTRHMLGRAEFERMNPRAWLFNVSRGGLVDHLALADALEAKQLTGAYLDVTEPEPLPADHPLWQLPNVFITGHSAGRSPRSRKRYAAMLLDNLERYERGELLRNVVDYTAGY